MAFAGHRQRNLVLLVAAFLVLQGCGGGEDASAEGRSVILERGRIGDGDTTDPDHMGLPYDGFVFDAWTLDDVAIEVETGEFVPMLKLMEVSTGAVLAEWDSEYPLGECLAYTIASPGSYEARVYSTDGGVGDYTMTITVSR